MAVFGMNDKFIELHRTFRELQKEAVESDDVDLYSAYGIGESLRWNDLINEYRVIILSEAGSGKTREIHHIASTLKEQNKQAFFLRLEDTPNHFEFAFAVGCYESFREWINSVEEGWLFLDSVDEARLRDPRDFARAIRKLGLQIQPAINRVHIIMTSRGAAWRHETDRKLCVENLPIDNTNSEREQQSNKMDGIDNIFEVESKGDEIANPIFKETVTEEKKNSKSTLKIVTLDDLTEKQIVEFAKGKGVNNSKAFLDEVERTNARSFTSRPRDLEELIEIWKENGQLGTGLDIIKNCIDRRLTERDPNRAEARPLAPLSARQGTKLLAAAATLTRIHAIRIPDGTTSSEAITVQALLDDWDEKNQATLLSRPIFKEADYDTVRFYHRTVREYLTAEWFANLLSQETSRRDIERLFFQIQYGFKVVVPSLRPIVPWIVILDDKIVDRVYEIAPDIFFEGGDPSQLPVELRRKILRDVCEKIASNAASSAMHDRLAVQRFAAPDLTNDVRELLHDYKCNDELTSFLLRMVRFGQLKGAKNEAMDIALDSTSEHYLRMVAFRAVFAIGTDADNTHIRQSFLNEASELNREWFAELIEGVIPTEETLSWLMECVEKTMTNKSYSSDRLTIRITEFVESAEIELIPRLITGFNRLLNLPPFIERRLCQVSEKYLWLLDSASKGVEKLVLEHHPASLEADALDILDKLPIARDHTSHGMSHTMSKLSKHIPAWKELNRALFWFAVERARNTIGKKADEKITNYWQASLLGSFWWFEVDDFEYAAGEIYHRDCIDDKLVALSLAFDLYKKAKRPRAWREKLKRLVKINDELSNRLKNYLRPPAQSEESRRLKQQENRLKRRSEAHRRQQEKYHADWKQWFNENLEEAQEKLRKNPGVLINPIYYLFEQTRDEEKSSMRWTEYNWKTLVPEYGDEVARFYRNSTVSFWRLHKPRIRSEGAPLNQTTFDVIIGLTGVEIEAHENTDWPEDLSPAEVELACRYASFELNGFPTWFSKLFESHPEPVCKFFMQEISYELSEENQDKDVNYLLNDVCWSGKWAWDELAPRIYDLLEKEPQKLVNLDNLLTIIQGSNLPDELIDKLASRKCRTIEQLDHLARWFAVWVGVSPNDAIASLKNKIAEVNDSQEQTLFAMTFITHLLGDRSGLGARARETYQTPSHLKSLYILMCTYIRPDEDTNRAGGVVYTPELRDEAQSARDNLFNSLKQLPGKESLLAIKEIAGLHYNKETPAWMKRIMKNKAEQDSDKGPWLLEQVKEFNDRMERTPNNHEELAELAVSRLLDLKYELEEGDSSLADILHNVKQERKIRKFIGRDLRDKAFDRYSIPQEEELADSRRPDLRFHGKNFDGPVPVELKLAEKWSGSQLFERLENQLCGDYLRDNRSSRGIFLLLYSGGRSYWVLPDNDRVDFPGLIKALDKHWSQNSSQFPEVEDISVIGIDLTCRFS